MPAFTWLSNDEVARGRRVPDDKECDDLLQELRAATGEDWVILTYPQERPRSVADMVLGRGGDPYTIYSLYADCHGEWQDINCVTAKGGSIFDKGAESREAIMNYMLGYLAGLQDARRGAA